MCREGLYKNATPYIKNPGLHVLVTSSVRHMCSSMETERQKERKTETTDETPNEPGVQDPNSVVRCTGG